MGKLMSRSERFPAGEIQKLTIGSFFNQVQSSSPVSTDNILLLVEE